MDKERDQFRARQERRAEMRQKQLQEQKRLRKNLIIAGVVALLCPQILGCCFFHFH